MSSKKDDKKKEKEPKKDTKDKKKDEKKDDKKKTDKKSDSKTKEKKKDDKKKESTKKDTKDVKSEKKTTKDTGAKKGPVQILKKEYKKWSDSAEETANLEWKSVNDEDKQVVLTFGKHEFYITYPESYPECDVNFFVFSTADGMDEWNDAMQDACDKQLTFTEVLSKCAENFLEVGPDVSEDSEPTTPAKGGEKLGEMDYDFGDDIDKTQSPNSSTSSKKVDDSEFANKKFLEIGSPVATLRLIQDLKALKKGDSESLGFVAKPKLEPGKNLENLYHWEVKLSGFTGEIGDDLKKYSNGHVELEMRFSKEYPFQPPFVRVVQPRFKFLTGHVTVGGSICMELLTNSGWRSTNDIESILIQIRAEMQEGGARLEGGSGSYTESEAWAAYYRAAKNHGWDVKGLDQNMFPKV